MVVFSNRLRSVLPAFIFLFIVLFLSSPAFPEIWEVPGDFATVIDAINSTTTKNGDTIKVVDPVTINTSNFNFNGKALKLVNEDFDPSQCVIQNTSNSGSSTVYMDTSSFVGSLIKGFTIKSHTSFDGEGGALNIKTSLTVENCIIRDSHAEDGGGVHISNASKPVFINCIFDNNTAHYGGAVYVVDGANPLFQNCLFKNNIARPEGLQLLSDGEVFYLDASPARLVNCTITASNQHNDAVIRQTVSSISLQISNCIIDAGGDTAIQSGSADSHQPAIENTYINGDYPWANGGVSMVYEPTRVMIQDVYEDENGSNPDPEYEYYTTRDEEYTEGGYFVLNFLDTDMYRLSLNSSCINAGKNSMAIDFEYSARPYYLKSDSDIGWDEFGFSALIDSPGEEFKDQYWFEIDLSETNHDEDTEPFNAYMNYPVGTQFQQGKVLYYKITPSVSGMMELWTEGSNVDLLGILSEDPDGSTTLITDGKNGTWLNFHMNYVYAREGSTYYLAVVNQGDSAGTFNLYGKITTDDFPNSCPAAIGNATSAGSGLFSQTYFDDPKDILLPTSDHSEAYGQVDFSEDEDVFILDFVDQATSNPMPGTLVITAQLDNNGTPLYNTTADDLQLVVKMAHDDAGTGAVTYEVVAENAGGQSVLIIFHNTSGEPCYVTVSSPDNKEFGAAIPYALTTRYYPLDEADGENGRFIALNGSETGAITYPGDQDHYYFVITQPGTIMADTDGCAVDTPSKINLYNPLHEKIPDNGFTEAGTGDYKIEEALVGDQSQAVPIFVTPGTYYMRVDPLNSHTKPFQYTVNLDFVALTSDDFGDYWELATVLYPWVGSPELYYESQSGSISSTTDADIFRVDVPYTGVLDVMVDSASTTGVIQAQLMNFKGDVLQSADDIRTADPACLTDAGANGRLTRELEKGAYYIKLYSESASSYPVDYKIAIDFDDNPDTPTGSVSPPSNWTYSKINAHIETVSSSGCTGDSHDVDTFRLDVLYENQFRIFTTGESDTSARIFECTDAPTCNTWTEYTAASTYLIQDYGDHNNFVIGFPVGTVDPEPLETPDDMTQFGITLPAGTYAVEVSMAAYDTTTGDYTIHFMQRDDYCNTYDCSGGLGVLSGNSGSQSGVIEIPGDIDYFRYEPGSDGRLTLTSINAKPSIIFKLKDSGDRRLTYSSSGTLEFDVSAGQTYYITVNPEFALNTGNYAFTYDLDTGMAPDDDGLNGEPGNDFSQANPLTLDSDPDTIEHVGNLDLAGDYDYYTFQITGAGVLRVFTTGTTDTYGYLFLESGNMYNLVMSDDDQGDGRNFEINYYVTGTGLQTFYVKVRGYAPRETGAYNLHIVFSTNDTDDHGDECETATPVNLNTGVLDNGQIVYSGSHIGIPGDNDNFKIVAGPTATDTGSLTVYTSDAAIGTPVDTFGYLKNRSCGTLALNDNGSGASDGNNFRIAYTPNNCVIGAAPDCTPGEDCECIPEVYHVLVRSYHGTETGSYDFHVETNGSFAESEGTMEINIPAGGVHYVGFDSPDHVSYLSTSVSGLSGFDVTGLTGTFMDGSGVTLERQVNENGNDVTKVFENMDMSTAIYVAGLERGLHYIKIENAGAAGSFDLALNCKPYGSVGFGNCEGSFSQSLGNFTVTSDGTGFDLTNSDDGFLAYQIFENGFEFVAKVTFESGYQNGAMAGLMVREADASDQSEDRYVMAGLQYNGGFQAFTRFRDTTSAAAETLPGSTATASNGYYVRLHYGGNGSAIVTTYSADGMTWSNENIPDLHLVPPLYVGYATASGQDGTDRTVDFTNIQYYELKLGEE